jgi:hypothetical protein
MPVFAAIMFNGRITYPTQIEEGVTLDPVTVRSATDRRACQTSDVLAHCPPLPCAFHFLNFTQSHPLHAAGRAMMGYRRATLTSHHKRKFVEKDLFASLTCFHSPARESRPLIGSGYLRVNKMARRSIIDLCVAAAAADSIKSL